MKDLTPRQTSKAQTMSFPTAMREVKNGKRVRRITWPKADYGALMDGWLKIFTKGKLHVWKVNDGDFEGEDWVVIKALN